MDEDGIEGNLTKQILKSFEAGLFHELKIKTMEFRIYNAGLILVWPFLTRFFEQLALVRNGEFVDDESNNRAVYLVHYLASFDTDYSESEMLLNKLLVGLPFDALVLPITPLTNEETEMAKSLMNGLIQNWPQVHNTSPVGIQDTFMQREGILRRDEVNNTLIVEKKGVDVLLESIPWNISSISLPWMSKPMHVIWI